jgi:arylsulfatase A-like enzyme
MLERVDEGIGAILDSLERKHLSDRTLVIVTNDNGGERLSRGAPLTGYKGLLLEGGVRVPCLIRWPGKLPAGRTSDVIGMTMDLTATVLAAAGARPPENRKLDGVDLVPILSGLQTAPERTLFWRVAPERLLQRAARKGKWKYIRHPRGELLFDLEADVAERKDLSKQFPEKLAELRGELARWEAEMDRSRPRFVVK